MPIKFKPIFICEGCGDEIEDPNQIRIFNGDITDGNKNKLYSNSEKMFCLNCIPLMLDFKNENPPTIQTIDDKINSETMCHNTNPIIESLQNELSDVENRLKNIDDSILVLFENIEQTSQNIQFLIEKLKPLDIYGKIKDSMIPHDTQIIQELVSKLENSNNKDDETQNSVIHENDEIFDDIGDYLVLFRITSNEKILSDVLRQCYRENIEDLEKILGKNINVKEVFYPINKYVSKEVYQDIEKEGYVGFVKMKHVYESKITMIDKFLFNVPNIIKVNALIADNIAFVSKQAI